MNLQAAGGARLEATLPRAFYFSDEIFARERERIFHREWFCAGREEQVRNAGDYVVLDVAGERILVVRDKNGALHAFFNVCRHRGCELVLHEAAEPNATSTTQALGRFPGAIRCPYHAWTYTLEGDLRTAPFLQETAGFDKGEFSLYRAGIESFGGFFFVNVSAR